MAGRRTDDEGEESAALRAFNVIYVFSNRPRRGLRVVVRIVGWLVGRWIDDEKELMMMGRRSNKKIDSLTGSECRIRNAID